MSEIAETMMRDLRDPKGSYRRRLERDAPSQLAGLSREELVAQIIALKTALFPFVEAFGELVRDNDHGTILESKLIPLTDNHGKFLAFDDTQMTSYDIDQIEEADLHKIDYYLDDGLVLCQGSKIDDSLQLVKVRVQDFYSSEAFVVTAGDAREATKLIYPRTTDTPSQSPADIA